MKNKLIIEKASAEDLGWVRTKLRENEWGYDSLDHVFVAKTDGKLIGMARVEFFRNKALATIAGVYVEPEARGNDIGFQLIHAILEAFPEVIEWYLAGHSWIEAYYSKMGFVKIQAVIPELKRSFDNQVFMVLRR